MLKVTNQKLRLKLFTMFTLVSIIKFTCLFCSWLFWTQDLTILRFCHSYLKIWLTPFFQIRHEAKLEFLKDNVPVKKHLGEGHGHCFFTNKSWFIPFIPQAKCNLWGDKYIYKNRYMHITLINMPHSNPDYCSLAASLAEEWDPSLQISVEKVKVNSTQTI